jgi:hypothetical protein
MNETITLIAGLIVALTVCILYRHVRLTVQIKDIVSVTLQADKQDDSEKSDSSQV